MSADTVRPCSVMGYPPFPVALVHTQMLGGGGRGLTWLCSEDQVSVIEGVRLLLEVFEDFKK